MILFWVVYLADIKEQLIINLKKEFFVMGAILVTGVLGPSIYLAANFQEYNGKAAARAASN